VRMCKRVPKIVSLYRHVFDVFLPSVFTHIPHSSA
jgi:hypothetical protein